MVCHPDPFAGPRHFFLPAGKEVDVWWLSVKSLAKVIPPGGGWGGPHPMIVQYQGKSLAPYLKDGHHWRAIRALKFSWEEREVVKKALLLLLLSIHAFFTPYRCWSQQHFPINVLHENFHLRIWSLGNPTWDRMMIIYYLISNRSLYLPLYLAYFKTISWPVIWHFCSWCFKIFLLKHYIISSGQTNNLSHLYIFSHT